MPNVKIKKLSGNSVFRKVAMGTWKTAKDPSVYAMLEIDMEPVLKLLPDYQSKNNCKISPTHLVGKAATYCMKKRPEINGFIRGKKIYLRDNIALNYLVNLPGTGDDKIKKATLAATTLHNADNFKLHEISNGLYKKASKMRSGEDKEISKNLDAFKFIPWCLTGLYLDFASFLMYGLNLDLSFLGFPKDPFGSVMITSVGSLGIDSAFAPLCPYTRIPLVLSVGGVSKKPWVVDDKVEVRSILQVCATFDHRLIDGVHAAQMAKDFKKCFANPEEYLLD